MHNNTATSKPAKLAAIEDAAGTISLLDSRWYIADPKIDAGGRLVYVRDACGSPNCRRHFDTVSTLFVDGHVKSITYNKLTGVAGKHFWTTSVD
jgi:prepilin-type processing-associated H-X9-DG protein